MKPRNGRLSKSILFTGFCVAVISTHLSNALDCYVCSYLDGYSDTSCLYNASAVKAINCTKKYCVTVRQELRRNSSKVISFLRDCQDEPVMLYGNRPDETFRTYYTSCQQNLCNGHNGRVKNSTNGSGGGGIHNAVVPGKSASQGLLISSWSLIFLPFLALWR
ncbi:uncharacterized protein LOC108096753 isoform X1 [Drosophila ficusphila]|uniref:uncharacterized protein LOC108096753 isoform X1 n=1 Tax=Drosophila ficusphila TaxID=30025 RepID=UPI0007E6A544|nr:uncharacterized protein LOC108096753 isoform X1 [Drosophila ficusphila]